MSRSYATDDRGQQHLLHLECDGCDAMLKPDPSVRYSGWTRHGWRVDDATFEVDYCPTCEAKRQLR